MSVSLPQPPSSYYQKGSNLQQHRPYKYVPYDVFETDWLGDSQLLHLQSLTNENIDTSVNSLSKQPDKDQRYAPGALVWVLLSKGKPKQPNHSAQSGYDAQCLHKKRRNKKNKRKVNDDDATTDDGVLSGEISNTDENVHAEKEASVNQNSFSIQKETTTLNHSRKEFFLRARVISDDEPISSSENGDADNGKKDAIVNIVKRNERRVLVRYSKGATYRVRAYNLVPVLEPTVQSDVNNLPPLVVIVPETNIYRRVAKIHTTPEDSFMEIGCDYGITVDKIYKSLEEAGDVPKVWPPVEIEGGVNGTAEGNEETSDRVACLGVDRSTESIDIANERYPKCKFALGNVLIPEEMTTIRTLCEQSMVGYAPSVICIDINGNREIKGVLECLDMVMKEEWKRQPRMIIVKSRFLYWELKNMEGTNA